MQVRLLSTCVLIVAFSTAVKQLLVGIFPANLLVRNAQMTFHNGALLFVDLFSTFSFKLARIDEK